VNHFIYFWSNNLLTLNQLLLFFFLIISNLESLKALCVQLNVFKVFNLISFLTLNTRLWHASTPPHELCSLWVHTLHIHLNYFETFWLYTVYTFVQIFGKLFNIDLVRARILLGLILSCIKVICQIFKSNKNLILINREKSEGRAEFSKVCLKNVKGSLCWPECFITLSELWINIKIESKEILRSLLDLELLLSLE